MKCSCLVNITIDVTVSASIMSLLSHLESIISVSEALKAQLQTVAKKKLVPKGQTIVTINGRCSDIFFIEKGLLRGYYFLDDKEVTNWFAREGEFATCFYSFISKESAFETIQALEDCELTQISYADLQALYSNFPETERIGRIITENYYLKLESRLLNIQFKTAKERYQNLLSTQPSLIQRASLGQIASYLGITQETLSRIRGEV